MQGQYQAPPHSSGELAMAQSQTLPRPISGPTTINSNCLPIDEGTLFAVGKECYCIGDIIRVSEPRHRNSVCDVFIAIRPFCLVDIIHFCLYPSWTYRVTTNTTPSPFSGERARHADQSVFRCVIGNAVRNSNEPRNRSNVHNRS